MAVMSVADAYRSAIAEEMRADPAVYCLGEDEDIPGGIPDGAQQGGKTGYSAH